MPQTKTIYLSLGSNIGDRAEHIARAIAALEAAGLRVTRRSSLYATEPVGVRTQSWFLNCCLEAETTLMPRQLLRVVREVERQFGRRRLGPGSAGGPRTVDIDILFHGATRMRSRELELPHPRIAERRFVLIPLREIAPGLRHPALRRTVAELLSETRDRSRVVKFRGQGPGAGG
jgi:2-amino-4-hydroxy-6-hydroxymethyldihydropteridine diphosphokinase